jgi:hypothetical protein
MLYSLVIEKALQNKKETKVQVKLSLVLIKYHATMMCGGVEV